MFGYGRSVLVVSGLLIVLVASPPQPLQGARADIPIRFVYTDAKAKQVCISGTFNRWSSNSFCMKRNGKTWSLVVSLPPGRYQYVFIIDGARQLVDPGAVMTEETGFGTRNSVLIVEEVVTK